MMENDKYIEYIRYDRRAQSLLETVYPREEAEAFGSSSIPPVYRAPYICYEKCISRYIQKHHTVLELGAGTGLHTFALVKTGARVVATDISPNSLKVISRQFKEVQTGVADMEYLPFKNNSFDAVAMAGALSYGDPGLVDAEIRRILRPGGLFCCVDSLNHNPFYRLNRRIHYLKGNRTKSTLLRMATVHRIASMTDGFKMAEIYYFGAVSFIMPLLVRIIGQSKSAMLSEAVDRLVNVRRSAFKFVLVARERL